MEEVARIARILAAHHGQDMADYLSPLLVPVLQRELKRAGISLSDGSGSK
jgi:hypothetical protein